MVLRIPRLIRPEKWVPIRLHKLSEDIAKKTSQPKLVLTLAPLYALEGGCDIYTELSAGVFAYRVADLFSPCERQYLHIVGPKTVDELLEKSPPSAVIFGVEPKYFESSLVQAAIDFDVKGWETKEYDKGVIVYFRR